MSIRISIVIPVYNEQKYIKECINSILSSNCSKEEIELLLVDGRSSDDTRTMIQTFQQQYSFIKLIDNIQKTAPIAMNLGIKEAKGKYIFILSAHATYNNDYFSKLVTYMDQLDACCVGGILETDVKNKNIKSNAIKEVLMHPLGVGNATFRTGSIKVQEVDTVAFGCYKKSTFEIYGLFNENLTRNQDIELNKRIVNGGGKIYLIPEIKCTYFARENFTDLAKNNYANGFWNILTAYYTKTLRSLSLRHFIPLLFVLSLFVPIVFSFPYVYMDYICFIGKLSCFGYNHKF